MDGETGNPGKIRVLCVDDHALMREALSAVIRNEPDMLLAAEATSGREAIESFRLHRPDVTLMELHEKTEAPFSIAPHLKIAA